MRNRKTGRLVIGIALLAMLVTVVAACGSSSSSSSTTSEASSGTEGTSSGGTAEPAASTSTGGETGFADRAAKYKQPITEFPGPTAPVTPPTGKKIVAITCSSQGAGCVRAAEGATEAGKVLGWQVTTIDGQGTPNAWNAAILNAISSHADGIVLAAVPPPLVGDALAKAKAAGIPVVEVFEPVPAGEAFASVNIDHHEQGEAIADWVADDSEEKAQVLVVEDTEFETLTERVEGFEEELSKCSGCKVVEHVNSQIGTMANTVPSAVASALQSHPEINYVVSPFDSNAIFASQGVQQAGKEGQVKVVGYEGDPQAVSTIREGGIEVATAADPAEWMGWQAVDALGRAMTGQKAEDTPVPWKVIDATNLPPNDTWTGDIDYQAEFEKLWGK
jgi:ribose transport system substrate-binding protein